MSGVLITGGAKRIGRALALHLVNNGYRDIIIHYNSSENDALDLKKAIEASGGSCSVVQADLSSWSACQALIPTLVSKGVKIKHLINNASAFMYDDINTLNEHKWQANMAVNLNAPTLLTSEFSKIASDGSSIVNIVDQKVANLSPYFTSYTLAKVALEAFTKMSAMELAPKIRVNAIAPGPSLCAQHQKQENFDKIVDSTLLKKPSSAENIAKAVQFLLESSTITGQTLFVDSGMNLSNFKKSAIYG